MLAKNEINKLESYNNIRIICPICEKKKDLRIPSKIINQSKQLTTISIPSGLNCEHGFQAFIDKNYKVRGYQKIDFEFSKIEFFEGNINTIDGVKRDQEELTSLLLFQNIIKLLRECVDNKETLGSAIFSFEGKVLYSSLPDNIFFITIREFEARKEKKLINLKRMLIELENNQKVCSEYMTIQDIKFILVLIFSASVKFGMGNLVLKELTKKIKKLEKK